MQHVNPRDLDLAFVAADVPRFSDLIERLCEADDLNATRKRDLISGLRRVATALNRNPEDVPCDTRWLQPRLAKISPAALRLSVKAWQNVTSDARGAMAWAGLVERRCNHRDDLAPEWQTLWKEVLARKERTISSSVRRFMHFLNRAGIMPEEVCEEHAIAYQDALSLNEISKSPQTAYITAINGWNQASRTIPGWPQITLTRPSRVRKIQPPAEDLPPSFVASLNGFIKNLQSPDPFAENGQKAPLSAATVKQYRTQLLRFAGELTASGVELAEIVDLKVLTHPDMAERGLRHMLAKNGGQPQKGIFETAALLRNLGKKLGAPAEAQVKLAHLATRLAPKKTGGMTAKNRSRLRVLQDDRQQQALLHLPERLAKRALQAPRGVKNALLLGDALAIAILLTCPIRVKNLAGIHLDHNLHRPGDRRAYLSILEDETKTGRPIEFELPPDTLKMMEQYLARRSPEICPGGTRWLFPRRDGTGPVDPSQLAARITQRIRREIGLEMNVHLFRHFAVMLWLDANPGSYEAARRLLGHSEVSHTINMYSGLEGQASIRAFSDLVTKKQKGRQ